MASFDPNGRIIAPINDDEQLAPTETAEDSPEFWRSIEAARAKGETLSEAALQPSTLLSKAFLSGSDDDTLHAITDGWASYRVFLSVSGVSQYDRFAGLLSSLGGMGSLKDRTVQSKFIDPLGELNKRELNNLVQTQKQYDAINEPHLAEVKKFLLTKIDPSSPTIAMNMMSTEKQLSVQRQFVDLTRFDVLSKAQELDQHIAHNALRPLLDCVQAHVDYFESGYNLISRFKERIEALRVHVVELEAVQSGLTSQRRQERRQLEKITSNVSIPQSANNSNGGGAGIVSSASPSSFGIRDLDENVRVQNDEACQMEIEGYLWVSCAAANQQHLAGHAGGGSAMPLTRAWCSVDSQHVSITVPGQEPIVMDLLLCTVKQPRELLVQNVFQIISPSRQFTFQTMSHDVMNSWMGCIQNCILHQLNTQTGHRKSTTEIHSDVHLAALWAIEGNDVCADCSAPRPDWTSKNLGILICQDCSGIHRSLGTHISKVRSLKLDRLDDLLVHFLESVGNTSSNAIWLSNMPAGLLPPTWEMPRDAKIDWISAKYSGRFLLRPNCTKNDINRSMFDAIDCNDLLQGMRLIALGADLEWVNVEEEMRTALHQAVDKNLYLFAEMLCQNGATVTVTEARGWSPLHYASYRDNVTVVNLLLRRGANVLQTDFQGMNALNLCEEYESNEVHADLLDALKKSMKSQANDQAALAEDFSLNPSHFHPHEKSGVISGRVKSRLSTFFRRDKSNSAFPHRSGATPSIQ